MADGPTRWAFALVHGIGTTKPIDLIGEVTDAMAVDGAAVTTDEAAEAYTAPAAIRSVPTGRAGSLKSPITGRAAAHQPVRRQYAQSGTFFGQRARFAAMEWSDISFYKEGIINLIGGLLLTSFGVRFFAEAAGSRNRFLSRLLRPILDLVVRLIAFFAFPFTLVSLVYSLMGILAENLLRGPLLVNWQTAFIVFWGMLISSAIAGIGLVRSQPLKEERPLAVPLFWCILVYALAIGALFIAGHFGSDGRFHNVIPKPEEAGAVSHWIRKTLVETGELVGHQFWVSRVQTLDEIGLFFGLMHWLQLAVGLIMLLLVIVGLAIAIVDDLIGWAKDGAGRSMVFAAVSVTSIWIVNLVIMWPENLVTATAMITYSKGVKAADQKAIGCGVRQGWLDDRRCLRISVYDDHEHWFKPQPAYSDDVPTVNKSGGPKPPPYNINAYYPLMWFEAAFIAFLMLVGLSALALMGSRRLWCSRTSRMWRNVPADKPPNAGRVMDFFVSQKAKIPRLSNKPRLIVSDLYIASVVALVGTCAVIMFAPVFGVDQPLLRVLAWLISFGGVASEFRVPHEISIPFTWVKLGVIGSLLLFVLGATYIRDMTKLGLDVVNHFTLANGNYPVRERIATRFDETVSFLLRPTSMASTSHKPHLVIISHSQGTVITFDAMMGRLYDIVKGKVATVTVLTFGSPISHVYQHYFSSSYPPLSEHEQLRALATDDRFRWFNIYRVDDYVGTYIANTIPNFPINVPMPPGGHIDYWNPDVFTRLMKNPEMQAWLEKLLASGNGGGGGEQPSNSPVAPSGGTANNATANPASNSALSAAARSLESAVKRSATDAT